VDERKKLGMRDEEEEEVRNEEGVRGKR